MKSPLILILFFIISFSVKSQTLELVEFVEGDIFVQVNSHGIFNSTGCLSGGGCGGNPYIPNADVVTPATFILYVDGVAYSLDSVLYATCTAGSIDLARAFLPPGVYISDSTSISVEYTCGGTTYYTDTLYSKPVYFKLFNNPQLCVDSAKVSPSFLEHLCCGASASTSGIDLFKLLVNDTAVNLGVDSTLSGTTASYSSLNGVYTSTASIDLFDPVCINAPQEMPRTAKMIVLDSSYMAMSLGYVSLIFTTAIDYGNVPGAQRYRYSDKINGVSETDVPGYNRVPAVGDTMEIRSFYDRYELLVNDSLLVTISKAITLTPSFGTITPNPIAPYDTAIWYYSQPINNYVVESSLGRLSYFDTLNLNFVYSKTNNYPPLTICTDSVVRLIVPDKDSIDSTVWYFYDPGWTYLDSIIGNPIDTVRTLPPGNYNVVVKYNWMCYEDFDTLTINVIDTIIPFAGNDDSLCNQFSYNFTASLGAGETGVWSFISPPPSTPIINSPTSPTSYVWNLTEGVYQFVWTVSNGSCPPKADTIELSVFRDPFAFAGTDQQICGNSTTLSGNPLIGLEKGRWYVDTLASPPNYPIFSPTDSNITNVTGLIAGTYYFIWEKTNGNCNPHRDTVRVDVFDSLVAFAGIDDSLCNLGSYTLGASPLNGTETGVWTYLSPTPSTPIITNPNSDTSYVWNLNVGLYDFVWTVSNGVCPSKSDTMRLSIFADPTANAGTDQTICASSTLLIANALPSGATGSWSLDSLASTSTAVNIVSPSSSVTSVNSLQEGSYYFIWTVTSGPCNPVSDTVFVRVYDTVFANAGNDTVLCNSYSLNLYADSLLTGYGEWFLDPTFPNPNVPIFADSSDENTLLSGLIEGTYRLLWVARNGNCPGDVDTILIHVYDLPVANAGPDTNLCGVYSFSFNADSVFGSATGLWFIDSLFPNPNTPTILNPSSPRAQVNGLIEGTYQFVWRVQNGPCFELYDTMQLTVYDSTIAIAGANIEACGLTSAIMNANTPAGTSTGVWTLIQGPSVPTFTNTQPNTSVNPLSSGMYQFEWTISNGVCPVSRDTVEINSWPIPTVNFQGIDSNICEGQCVDFSSLAAVSAPDSIITYIWDIDGNSYSDSTHQVCFQNPGAIDVFLKVITNNGCTDSVLKNNYIEILPNPIANFDYTIGPESDFDVNIFDRSIYASSGVKYFFGDGDTSINPNPTHTFLDSGYFDVMQVAYNHLGCTDTIIKTIFINYILVYVPNTFTPDGDGINDVFFPVVDGEDPAEFMFRVFNRWGQLLFESQKKSNGWDGTYKGEMSKQDTYVWTLTATSENSGKKVSYYGHVNLLK